MPKPKRRPGRPASIPRAPIVATVIAAMGGQERLADALGISFQAVSQWRQIPIGQVLKVEKKTGISRHKLRPDIYGRAPQ